MIETLRTDLQKIAQLPENWDSYGAASIDPACVKEAEEVILLLEKYTFPHVDIIPSCSGGLVFYIEDRNEREVRVKIEPTPDEIKVIRITEMRAYHYYPYDFETLKEHFEWLINNE